MLDATTDVAAELEEKKGVSALLLVTGLVTEETMRI